jgi:hypothetical protein
MTDSPIEPQDDHFAGAPSTAVTAPDPAAAGPRLGGRGRIAGALWAAVIFASKALTIAFGIDALLNHASPRLRGKAIRTRAFGYVGGLFVVPLLWRLLPDRGRYPRELDLAVTVPLLLDAGGNAFGMYERAHIDDVVHTANSAIVAGVAGSLFAPHVDERWQAALAAAGVSVAAGSAWEVWEYIAWRLGAEGMNLTYSDTMDDIIEGFLGAGLGALFALTRAPRSKAGRQQVGWRGTLGS